MSDEGEFTYNPQGRTRRQKWPDAPFIYKLELLTPRMTIESSGPIGKVRGELMLAAFSAGEMTPEQEAHAKAFTSSVLGQAAGSTRDEGDDE